MEIMDPFVYELLAHPPLPGFDLFSGGGGAMNTKITIEQLDDYFRAIGVLPTLPPVHVPPTPGYTIPAATLCGTMDLPATCVLQPAAPQPAPPSPSAIKNSATYDADIDASLRAMESDARERPSPDYLDTTQGGRMDPMTRATLVMWMCEFARQFDLGPGALHRAVSYADRYLSARAITGVDIDYQLRLLGAAAVYAAAKYEDRGAARNLNAREIACCCGFAASQEVLSTERALVVALGYRLGGPTAHTFVEHFTRHSPQGGEDNLEQVRHTAHLIADTSLFDHRCLKILPSAVAAAAILLARLSLKPSHDDEQVRRWSRELEEQTGYRPLDVYDGVDCMYKLMPDTGFEVSPLFFADPT